MAKDWITIKTVNSPSKLPITRAEKNRKAKNASNLIRNTKTLSLIDLKKHSTDLYNKCKEEEDNLLQAFEDKRLKSEKAIKQAIRIKKEREKKQKIDAKQDPEKVSETLETPETTESSV